MLKARLLKTPFDKVLLMKFASIPFRFGLLAFVGGLAPSSAFAHGGHTQLSEVLHGVFHAWPLAAALAALAISVVFYRRSR
jgi:hypothetical protein